MSEDKRDRHSRREREDVPLADIPVVILCGGQGTRLREETEYRPKPMVEIGSEPILWHIMKLYHCHGLRRFILCLGYKGWVIKQYFLNYSELHNDLTLTLDGSMPPVVHERERQPGEPEIGKEDWEVTLAETGQDSGTGARIWRIRDYLDQPTFCLTYGDAVGRIDVASEIAFHREQGRIGTVLGVRPTSRYGEMRTEGDLVSEFREKPAAEGVVSGGFFVFQREFIDYLNDDPQLFLELDPLRSPRARRPAFGVPARRLLAPDGHLPRLSPPQRPLARWRASLEDLVSEGQRQHLYECRSCGAPLASVALDLGASPLANSYLRAEQLSEPEPHYPLCLYVCDDCLLLQLPAVTNAAEIFSDYAYFSSFSDSWLEHARRYCEDVTTRFGLDEDSLVVEVASNDGYLLRNFVSAGIPAYGIEPATNIARVAVERGVPTINRFLGEDVGHSLVAGNPDPGLVDLESSARELLGRPADLLVANNVFAHVPDVLDFARGLRALLAPDGVATIEVQHLLQLVEQTQFDTVYHEHFSYYSVATASRVLEACGLVVFDAAELGTHGGSMRLFCKRDDAPEDARLSETGNAAALIERERAAGLLGTSATNEAGDGGGYGPFRERVRRVKRDLLRFLLEAQEQGEVVAAYGAPAKGNTLLNYCGIGRDLVSFTVDRNPEKQGRYLPGSRIPILSPETIEQRRPRYVLVLPWNLADEIESQMSVIRDWGGQFLRAVPKLEIW